LSDAPRPVAPPTARPTRTRKGGAEPGSAAVLRQSASFALDSISEGLVIVDRGGRFVYVNPAAERFMRKPAGEVLGQSLREIFPDAVDRTFGVEYRRAVAENVPVHFEEFYPEPLSAWYEVRVYPGPEGSSIFFRDVTARREVEAALRRSEERYRALFDSMTEGFALHEIVCGGDGVACDYRFLDVNPAFERQTGLKRDDVVGRLVSEVLPTNDQFWVKTYGVVALTGESVRFEHYAPALGRHYEVFAYRPAPRHFAVLFHDITARKQLEDALQVNLTKYSVLFGAFPLGISVSDPEGNIREANATAARLLGVPLDEHTTRRIDGGEWRIVRPDGSPMPPEEYASVRALKEQRLVEDVEMGIVSADEAVTWLSVSAAPLPLEGYGVVVTYGDVSQRRQAEAALKESEERHRSILQTAMDGFWVVDAQGRLLEVNDAYCRMSGYSAQELLGCRVSDLEAAETPDETASHRKTVITMGEDRFESRHRRKDGSVFDVEISVQYRTTDGGRFVAFLRDITERKRTERDLERARKHVLAEQRRVEVAARSLADSEAERDRASSELSAANEALRRNNQTLEARVAERTADLLQRTTQLRTLALELTRAEERERQRVAQVIHDHLQQLLSVARINIGMAVGKIRTPAIRRTLGELDDLIAESLDITRSLTAELSPQILYRSGLVAALRWLGRWYEDRFGLTVGVEADEEQPIDEGTRVTVFRCVRELLFNVVKHARSPNALIRVSWVAGGRVRIVVSDQGVGVSPGLLRALDGEGEGFGLFSLRERLELIGGRLEVTSAPGRGASFTIIGPPPAPEGDGTPAAAAAARRAIAVRKPARARRQKPSRTRKQ
jgi:PAS domain S-box-containing protein